MNSSSDYELHSFNEAVRVAWLVINFISITFDYLLLPNFLQYCSVIFSLNSFLINVILLIYYAETIDTRLSIFAPTSLTFHVIYLRKFRK